MKIELTTTETIGHQIRELARSKNIRMCHLCEQIGIKQGTFTKMIKRNPKSIEVMIKFFEVLSAAES
jgi:hypothetical protein